MTQVYIKRVLSILMICTPLAFIWMACWVTVFPMAKRRSRQQLPAILKAIGLIPDGARGKNISGTIEGVAQGYSVRIEPDSAEIFLEFNRWKSVEINDQKPYHATRDDLRDLSTQSSLFNAIFRTRRVLPDDLPQIADDLHMVETLEGFYMKWLWRLQFFRIDDNGLHCRLNCGHPFSSYIPAPALEPLLGELCRLAAMIEDTLTDKPE